MFAKRALVLAVLLVGAFAQDTRDLAVSKPNEGGEIKVVKNKDDVLALAGRWAASLIAGWNTTATVNTARILGEYAPDGAMTMYSSKGGFDTGSQLLPTVSNTPATTNDLRKTYFEGFLAGKPIPKLDPSMKVRLLSKDVATLAGNWEFTFDGKRGTPVKARVLVVWKKYNRVTIGGVKKRNQWLIVEMHSSLLPATYCDVNNPKP